MKRWESAAVAANSELAKLVRNISAQHGGIEFSSSSFQDIRDDFGIEIPRLLKRCDDVRRDPLHDCYVIRGKTVDGDVIDVAVVIKFVAQRIKILRAWSVTHEEIRDTGTDPE